MKIVGRKKELSLLHELRSAPSSAFVAVYGRRRVGKTFLIRNAFEGKFEFHLTGLANTGLQQQLANFNLAFKRIGMDGHEPASAASWFEAFQLLSDHLESLPNGKKVIFLDELPWMDTPKSGFITALEHFWNAWASARNDIILIVCGSAASWMINQIINNKGGLHNRITHTIKLEPFSLSECEEYFRNRAAGFDRYQLIQLYMVLGGIPFYLDKVQGNLSAAQNINRLAFDPNSFLRGEFENLYRSLFNKAEKHIAIIETLSTMLKGMSREELMAASNMVTGGSTTRILKELEESGFIRKYTSFGKMEKYSLYQLSDFYSLFYLKWIRGSSTLDANTWINELDSPRQRAWSGYAFEQVCLAHVQRIKEALSIAGVQTHTASWVSTDKNRKAQVDLVIDRRDQVINICEMKFSINPFSIDKKYAEELRHKLAVFREVTDTRKAIHLTMITTFGLKRNEHANSLVQNDLTMDILF